MQNARPSALKTRASRAARSGGLFAAFGSLPQVRSLGRLIFDPVWAQKRHNAGSNELIHVMRGSVRVHLESRILNAAPGQTLLVPKGAMHRDEFDLAEGLEVFMIFFFWPPAKRYFRLVPPEKIPALCGAMDAESRLLFDKIRMCLDSGLEPDRMLINTYLLEFLLLLLKQSLRDGAGPAREMHQSRRLLAQKAREYIDAHYAEPLSLARIAEALKVSAFYLSHVFGLESDFSFTDYLTARRMGKALELLRTGRYSVAQTAYAVGYHDSHYFSRVFHRRHGIAPGELKNRPQKTQHRPA